MPETDRKYYAHLNGRPLSEREITVLELMSEGYTDKEIAGVLEISYGSVRKDNTRTICKLNAYNIKHALALAIRTGVIE